MSEPIPFARATTRASAARRWAALLLPVFLAACTSFSPDGGLTRVSQLSRERTGQSLPTAGSQERLAQLLAQPVSSDGAVELALFNNRSLQAALAELRVAEADLVQAGRLRNPGFSFTRLRTGEDLEIDRAVFLDLGGLLTMPLRRAVEQRRFDRAQLAAAANVVNLAAEVRRAWVNAIATRQSTEYWTQVVEAAQAGAELGQRLARVGNWSKLDQAREQAFHAESIAQLARARQAEVAAREQLTRLLGLGDEAANLQLPQRLPPLPAAADEMGAAESQAMQSRLDVQLAKSESEATAAALGLTRALRFVNVLELGYVNKSESTKPRGNGYEISLELPLFDWGTARQARAEAIYMQTLHAAADTAIRARSQVRESYSAYRSAYDVARHYRDEVVPLRKKISEEVLLRYNGMLASTFELLTDARDQAAAVSAAIDAQRDFWLAQVNLQAAISGTGPARWGPAGRSAVGTGSAAVPAAAGH